MYIGKRNEKGEYSMSNSKITHVLEEITEEKDLGVFVTSDLEWNKQCTVAAMKANRTLVQIKNCFKSLGRESLRRLYTSLVRPHLEYAVNMWRPYLKTDVKIIERVQRRATKLVDFTRVKPYEERLKDLNLFSLENRRLRGDLIQM